MIDAADYNQLEIHFDADLLVPARQGGKLAMRVFPEHDDTLPTEYTWEIEAGSYLP